MPNEGTGIRTNRSHIDLPPEVSSEILQKMQEDSVIMRLADEIEMPGTGKEFPMITGDPEPEWVAETGQKKVDNPSFGSKIVKPYTLAVVVPFSNQFKRDAQSLYDALVKRLPRALAKKYDATCFGNVAAPGEHFDSFANCTVQPIGGENTYDGLVAADIDIAEHDGLLDGYVFSPRGRGILLRAKDADKRPLFINNVSEGAVPYILGAKTYFTKAAYKAGTPNIIGIAGDWTQAMWGMVDGINIDISDQGTIITGEGEDQEVISLFQRNMFAVRAEMEIGFRADTACFNLLSDATGE